MAESTAYRFVKLLRKEFGNIEGVTDKDYLTNSSHVPVACHIDAKRRLILKHRITCYVTAVTLCTLKQVTVHSIIHKLF